MTKQDEITITREGAEWICDSYVKANQANKEAAKIVGGLLWHIEIAMDYDCDAEVYEGLWEIAKALEK